MYKLGQLLNRFRSKECSLLLFDYMNTNQAINTLHIEPQNTLICDEYLVFSC